MIRTDDNGNDGDGEEYIYKKNTHVHCRLCSKKLPSCTVRQKMRLYWPRYLRWNMVIIYQGAPSFSLASPPPVEINKTWESLLMENTDPLHSRLLSI